MDDIAVCIIWMMTGAGLCALLWKIIPFVIRAWWPERDKRYKDIEWQEETNRAFVEMMEDQLQLARSKAHLASLVGKVPEGFDPVIWESFSIAAQVEKQVLAQAESEGLVAPEMIAKIYEPKPPEAYVPEEAPAEPSNIRRLPSGRFLPRRVG